MKKFLIGLLLAATTIGLIFIGVFAAERVNQSSIRKQPKNTFNISTEDTLPH